MKVLLICNTDGAMYIFRKPIIKALVSRGDEVVCASGESDYFKRLSDMGARPVGVPFARHSIGFFSNLLLLIRLFLLVKAERPDVVHSFTHKPAIFGSIAAWLAGVRNTHVTITGLGNVFVHDDWKTKVVRRLLLIQYKIAMKCVDTVFFQNPDDKELFVRGKVVPDSKAVLTAGSGLDLSEFPAPSDAEVTAARARLGSELGVDLLSRRVVIFPARGVPEKGVFEFYEAGRLLSDLFPGKFVFVHLGLIDAVGVPRLSKEGLPRYADQCKVRYLGFKDDIQAYMRAADVVALPSKYREGIPRSLIEALGLGKVVVTTDMPGCREIVLGGWNGYLCRPGDTQDFASKILQVTDSFAAEARTRSRKYCETRFDAALLVEETLRRYGQLG